ncbi:GNAT family N-acetyltransferase [Thermaerobacter sp. PB12/4term]|uniref:GNAT family N-acetyltransferase n=1 Tax=Thermaerobacter sp. PB12/4term TaxID=2293838 RepID=UPI000E32C3AC|nr:GNAT family N-acetyltransferase [Thermaerobacter sp. PB12/4term]QIA27981.1 GNAT family N-acetyltransferase [Thermaerobacter sp. PB12/4term]
MTVQIRGQRVVLTPLTPADLAWLVRWERDPAVARFAGQRFDSLAGACTWWQAAQADPRHVVLAVRLPSGQVIGDVELVEINWVRREAELRIRIGDPRYRGRGLGRDAVRAAARYAAGIGLKQLFLRVDVRNVAALRCYRAAGFRSLGRFTAGRRKADGLADMYLMVRALDARPGGSAGIGPAAADPRAAAAD